MKKIALLLALTPGIVWSASNQVSITVENGVRTIKSNGIPHHSPGRFPNQNNPNRISEQSYHFTVPQWPTIASSPTDVRGFPFGVAMNGVPFDPGTAEFYNNDRESGWQYEALSGYINLGLDSHNAHVQPSGAYHYHGLPHPKDQTELSRHPSMAGFAADGFPIYAQYGYAIAMDNSSAVVELRSSYRLKRGERDGGPGGKHDGRFVQDYQYYHGLGDLDACNGRYGRTPEYPNGTYYYVLTREFPFVPRCLVGTVDPSFLRHRGPDAAPMGGRQASNHPPRRGAQSPQRSNQGFASKRGATQSRPPAQASVEQAETPPPTSLSERRPPPHHHPHRHGHRPGQHPPPPRP